MMVIRFTLAIMVAECCATRGLSIPVKPDLPDASRSFIGAFH
jgi:hypothetical protein